MEKYARIDYIPYFRFLEIPRSSINAIEAQDKRTRGMLFFLLNPQLFGNLWVLRNNGNALFWESKKY